MPVYAHCPSCRLDFSSQGFQIAYMKNSSFSGARETCPRCGKPADVMEGTFNVTPTHVELIQGPQWSKALIDRVQAQLRVINRIAESPQITDDEARPKIAKLVSGVEAINPVVAAEFRRRTEGQPRGTWSAVAKAITAALAAIGAYNTVADFSDRVADLLRYFLDH